MPKKPATKKQPVAKKKPTARAAKPATNTRTKAPATKPATEAKPVFPALFFFFEVLAVRMRDKPYGETIAVKVVRALQTFTDHLHDDHDALKKEAKLVLGADRVAELLPLAVMQGVEGLDVDAATSMLRAIIDSERYDAVDE